MMLIKYNNNELYWITINYNENKKEYYFINPINNYRYVYVSNHSDFNAASSYYNSNLDGKYFGDLWIMTVNASPKSDVVFTKKQTKNSAKTAFNYKPKNNITSCKKERYS